MYKFKKLDGGSFFFTDDDLNFTSTIAKVDNGWKVQVWRRRTWRLLLIDSAIYPSVHLCKNFAWAVIHEELRLMLKDWSGTAFKNEFIQDHDNI